MARTILVVEDEPDILLAIRLALEIAGYRVLEAPSAEDALTVLETERPDAMVLDLRLPGMDGLALLGRLRSSEPFAELPVIVSSALSSPETTAQAQALGCVAYLTKPFAASDLQRAVAQAIGSPP